MATTPINEFVPYVQYTAAVGATEFAGNWWIGVETDVDVYKDGVLQGSGYTVTGLQDPTGFTVTFATPMTGGEIITLSGDFDIERLTGYLAGGSFRAESLNLELSTHVAIMLQLQRNIDRKVGLDITSEIDGSNLVLPVPADDHAILWDGTDGTLKNSVNSFANLETYGAAINAIISDIVTVAGISANVTTVATNNANVTTVATNIIDVNTVVTNIVDVNTVADNIANINTVESNITDILTVASAIGNVNTVAALVPINVLAGLSIVNITDYGASTSATPAVNFACIEDSIADLSPGRIWYVPEGTFEISQMPTFNKTCAGIYGRGVLKAATGFTDDNIFYITREQATDKYNEPIPVYQLNLHCNLLTRGLKRYRLDHSDTFNVRVEQAWGAALQDDKIRESTHYSFKAINCKHRDRFSTPSDWSNATAYTVGERVRRAPDSWTNVTTYGLADIVKASDGLNYISLQKSNLNNDPASNANPAYWHWYPFQDYECVIDSTNEDPLTYNTNNSAALDQPWKKVYQTEYVIEVNDDVQLLSDRSNQVTFYSLIVRECSNPGMFLVDNQRLNSYSTHVNIENSHLHYLQPEVSGAVADGSITTQSYLVGINVGRCQNINVKGTNIRLTDSDDAIGLLIGDEGKKTTSSVRLDHGCPITGEGDRQAGIIVAPNALSGGGSSNHAGSITLSGSDTIDILDKTRFFSYTINKALEIDVPATSDAAPTGITVTLDNSYADARMLAAYLSGDSSPRIRFQISSNIPRLQFGSGSSALDCEIKRIAANVLGMADGDSWYLQGTYDGGTLRFGSTRVWENATTQSLWFKNSSNPSADNDGIPYMAGGQHEMWIPATEMFPTTTAGCAALANYQTATNAVNMRTLDFDPATEEHCSVQVAMPKKWDGGTVTFQFYWTAASGATNNVIWGVECVSASDGDTLDQAFPTSIIITDNFNGTAGDLHVSDETANVTIGGSPVAGDLVVLQFLRAAALAGDTFAADAKLIGVKMFYNIDKPNDA